MMTVNIEVEALEGVEVMAKNYRTKDDRWERGTVIGVTAKINRIGRAEVQYRVLLRRHITRGEGRPDRRLVITVGHGGLEVIKK